MTHVGTSRDPAFAIRREIIDYASLPISSWLPSIDSVSAVLALVQQLSEAGAVKRDGRCFIGVSELADCLEVPVLHAKVLCDCIDSVTDDSSITVQRSANSAGSSGALPEPEAVEVHAVGMYLFAQLYIRQAQRPDAMETWPSQNGELAGTSPSRHTQNVSFQPAKTNQLARSELFVHAQQHQHLLSNYLAFMTQQTVALLDMARNQQAGELDQLDFITSTEFDRLSLLLRPLGRCTVGNGASPVDSTHSTSPMDTERHSPFTSQTIRLSAYAAPFQEASHPGQASISVIAAWLEDNIVDEASPAESVPHQGDSLPSAGIAQGLSVDVQGIVKSTVVRGEDDFPAGVLRVLDCHDCVVYALAPLQYAQILGCSNTTLVVGAASRMLRIQGCTRVTVIATAVRVCIESCHECTFYLGVNRPPLLVGLNRFIQMAPYNTQYERLGSHMATAGVAVEPNLWDRPITLARAHAPATPDSEASMAPGSSAMEHPPVQLLPPDSLVPFLTPFRGVGGPLCGGAASHSPEARASLERQSSGSQASPSHSTGVTDLSFMDGPAMDLGAIPTGPFPLPPAYEHAKDNTVRAVADLRTAVKQAVLDDNRKRELQTVIQAHFKEWLHSSGNLRQVYDLARMEREDVAAHPP